MTREELLTLLIEECAEVIQAATKCQRFGFDDYFEGYGFNHEVLAAEMGDVHAVIHEIIKSDPHMVTWERRAREGKIAKAERWKHTRRAQPTPSQPTGGDR